MINERNFIMKFANLDHNTIKYINKKLVQYEYDKVSPIRPKKYYDFQSTVLDTLLPLYDERKIRKQPETHQQYIYGSPIEVKLWNWANQHKKFILNEAAADKISKIQIISKNKKKQHVMPSENEIISARNKKSMYRAFDISKFNKPKDQEVHHISADRSEFGQYMNEPVYLLGKIVRMTKDYDSRGQLYTKILLVNVQYYPTNPKYMLKKALFLPDHIWIDVSSKDLIKRTYQIDDYAAFYGIVGEYRSKINKFKSPIKNHRFDYWRTKYNIIDHHFESEGTPIINENNMIKELVFNYDPSKSLNAAQIPNPIKK